MAQANELRDGQLSLVAKSLEAMSGRNWTGKALDFRLQSLARQIRRAMGGNGRPAPRGRNQSGDWIQ